MRLSPASPAAISSRNTPSRSWATRLRVHAAVACAGLAFASAAFAHAVADAPAAPAAAAPAAASTTSLWDAARDGDKAEFLSALRAVAAGADPAEASLAGWAARLAAHYDQREADRLARIDEINAQLDAALEKPETDLTLAESLRHAIELDLVHAVRGSITDDPRIKRVVERAVARAHEEEAKGNLLPAGELFALLNGLYDIAGTYRPDVNRLNQRLSMVRFYAPQRLWEQRNTRLLEMGEKPLPPYNPVGDDFRERLRGVDATLVLRALAFTPRHVDGPRLNAVVTSGLDALASMATTRDLAIAFPKLTDQAAVDRFLASITRDKDLIARREGAPLDMVQLDTMLERILREGAQALDLPREAMLHEFGNGAFLALDEYSAVIWPDELRRFEKSTQGRFVGVGVQIEFNEQSAVRVVTPLEGTPAHRAGIRPGDVITQVNGKNIYGLSLDQVVDQITGPQGTDVTLTVERELPAQRDAEGNIDPANDDVKTESLTKVLTRDLIKVATVKGWERDGSGEYDWNWFVDKERGIGYVRLTQFADETGRELDSAIASMRKDGLSALILDLRFNPGGLMDQAVRVASRVIKVPNGEIVMARGATGRIESTERTRPSQATLADIPLIVLVNEGSASASEIVSGAIAHYSKTGDADALILGARTFGKGSVQNVWRLTNAASMKLTIQYYMLPDQTIIHRKPGQTDWGVEPNLTVDMLPKQTTDVLTLRRDADVMRIDENGVAAPVAGAAARPDPNDLLTKGLDPQLETALLLLRARIVGGAAQAARPGASPEAAVP
jgi:carboxyl-terminal processing protease